MLTVMDGHGDGRSKRSGTVRNDLELSENIGQGHVTVTSRHGHVTSRSRFRLKTKDSLYLIN